MRHHTPKIGFIAPFSNLGDTLPLIEIARRYKELGGKAVFIGYPGKYEKFVNEIGCKLVKIEEKISEELVKKRISRIYKYHYRNRPSELVFYRLFNTEREQFVKSIIGQEIEIIKKEKIELLVASYNTTVRISARALNIPLVVIISGVTISSYYRSNLATFPDNFENFFTRLIPNFIKNRFINWYLLQCRWNINGFNRLAKNYNVAPVKCFLDIFRGDYTFVADDINFLNLKPTSDFPLKNFVGPILIDQPFKQSDKMLDSDVETRLRRSNRTILFTLGSSGTKKIYLEILKTLNKTNYNVIAVYTTILKEDEPPKLNDNILLKKFVPSIKKINENVDLAIIHGGRGTVYTAAFSGKPVIGIPMHSEQQFNIDNLVRHGSAIRLSKKFFNEKQLLLTIKKIFDNYDSYLGNAQSLKKKLQNQNGAENAVKRILEILNENDKN